MANPVIGQCVCPLCKEPGAELRQGVKQALYIVCDNCVSQVRTMSRTGRSIMQKLIGPARIAPEVETDVAPLPVEPDEKTEAPPQKPAKKPAASSGSWLGL